MLAGNRRENHEAEYQPEQSQEELCEAEDIIRSFVNCFADSYFQTKSGGDESASKGKKEEEKG